MTGIPMLCGNGSERQSSSGGGTVRNNSNERKRVYVYYDLLDSKRVPIARNVTNRYIEPHETVEITADSYILTEDLPKVKSSRAVAKTGF